MLFIQITAQQKFPVSLAVGNSATQLPGSGYLGFINTPIHPGITAGTFKSYNKKNNLFQTLKLSYFYHHYSHKAFQLFTELRYDKKFCEKFFLSANIGAGYMYTLTDLQAFKLNDNGTYSRTNNYGRSQFTAGIEFDLNYNIIRENKPPVTLFMAYNFRIQTPFVNEYVPILPYTSINIGTIFFINKSEKK